MSKAEIAITIYREELAKGDQELRKRVIARIETELSMGKAGASTYYQNTKNKLAANGTLQLVQKAPPTPPPAAVSSQPPAKAIPVWSRYDTDENGVVVAVDCFYTAEEARDALLKQGGACTIDTKEVAIGDVIK